MPSQPASTSRQSQSKRETALTDQHRVSPSAETWLNRPDGLSERLRDLRTRAGLTGVRMAGNLGWPQSKISKIENGRQVPTEEDITGWASECSASQAETTSLLGLLVEIHGLHRQWRQRVREEQGQSAIQRDYDAIARKATVIRNAETILIPGLLQTAGYARSRAIESARIHNADQTELDTVTAERMRRQQVLYDPGKTFEFVIAEAALRHLLCPPDVMRGQLDRLLALTGMPNLTLAIIPFGTPLPVTPQHGFVLFDDLVIIETFTEEIIHRGSEAAAYAHVMDDLRAESVVDEPARQLIVQAIHALGEIG